MWRAKAFVVLRHAWRQEKRLLSLSVQAGGWLPPSFSRDRSMDAWMLDSCWEFVFSVFPGQVVNALEANPTARRTQLHHKFEQVIALVEDNIYECCSEAWTRRPLLLAVSFSCCQLPSSRLPGYLGMPLWSYCAPVSFPQTVKRVNSGRAKDLNLPPKHHIKSFLMTQTQFQSGSTIL